MDISSRALHETLEFDGIWGIPSTCWSDPILYTTRLNHGFSWIFHFASCRRRVFRSSCTVRSLVANVNILNVSLFAYIFAVCMHIYIYIYLYTEYKYMYTHYLWYISPAGTTCLSLPRLALQDSTLRQATVTTTDYTETGETEHPMEVSQGMAISM